MSEGLAKVAKDAVAIENITPGEALEKLLLAVESGASRGLRTMGIPLSLLWSPRDSVAAGLPELRYNRPTVKRSNSPPQYFSRASLKT